MNELESAVAMWRRAWEYPVPDDDEEMDDAERDERSLCTEVEALAALQEVSERD